MVRVRLTRKFADFIDGVDLRKVKSGDALNLSPEEARILIAEGWAKADASDPKITPRKKKLKRAPKRDQ